MTTSASTTSDRSDPLGLTNVLPGSLPRTLGTAETPDSYEVDAVFSRRPSPEEVVAIHSAATKQALVSAGYPSVTLRVSDRRLEIHGTTLEQLEMGLATLLADQLAQITSQIRDEQATARKLIEEAAGAETTRADSVATRAAAVRFQRSDDRE